QWNIDPKDVGAIEVRRNKRSARPRSTGRIAGAAVAAVVAGTLAQGAAAFAATPPVFPENILVFPNRDFVSLSGYQLTRPGQTATITVHRGNILTGQAEGKIALPTADATLPSLEVNHPGGVCWGTGVGAPNVTPDIKPGDVVAVAFSGGGSDSTVTQSPTVTGFTHTPGSTQVVVNGNLNALGGPNGIPAQMEQRTIQPLFTTTAVVKRDVRAVLGPVIPDVTGSYSSGMTATATTFTATYNFTLASNADLMAQGDMRANSWQTADLAGNRQGLTLAEFGMSGGTMPGCSAQSPGSIAPNAPANVGGISGDGSLTATWDAATTIPDGSPVTGYVVEVQAVGTASFLRSIVAAGVRSAPFTGLTNGTAYTIQVFAQSAAGQGPGGTSAPVTPSPLPTTLPGAPTIAAATAGNASATVRWTAPVGRVPDSYTVEATTGTTVTTVPVAAGTATSTVVTGLTNGVPYTFRVAAVNILGPGAQSAASIAVTPRADFVVPTVTARTPGVNALVQSQVNDVTATFSEAVQPATLTTSTFSLRAGAAAPVAATVSYNATTRVASLNPAASLAAGTKYTATLSSGVLDLAGNALATTTWSFSTGPALAITARSPVNLATNVRRGGNVTFTLNRAPVGATVNGTRVRLTIVSTGAGIGNLRTVSGSTVTFNPGGTGVGLLPANTQFRMTLSTGITDAAGNPLAATSWVFNTGTLV
ncbi:MAG: hypothetical protein QOF35_113, partial [Actinomycetota bacterium]|nr:hypothetical protein [Actinomycetota bacterium]